MAERPPPDRVPQRSAVRDVEAALALVEAPEGETHARVCPTHYQALDDRLWCAVGHKVPAGWLVYDVVNRKLVF